eukprot:CAMPEP_0202979354 /NCGR_PEP_ID=MMETSP1396-20130829/85532_1 /ASSEMBLY_ACC=CAM_ASM_000872 /TAXON_ID= /ORGANISM="Pseudokeronopsis sp., Strain Brazil" /LENGTH=208 /DNA_ID=CAMNT_0049718749 /DNA_START=238 /DNA_END=864 /DNA_ORIENTATION=+
MQFTSNIVALVGQGDSVGSSQKKLTLFDIMVQAPTCEIQFVTKILALKINYAMLFAATKDTIFLYDLNGMKIVAKIAADNHLGRVALSPNNIANPFLIYSTSFKQGELIVFDYKALQEANRVFCHNTIILKLTIGYNGDIAATCSTNGSTIRVFSLPSGDKLCTFNRKLEVPMKFNQQQFFVFSEQGNLLVSCYDSGNISVYKVHPQG